MLIYVRCPTCSRVLSKNYSKYRAELNNIRFDPKKTKHQKEIDSAKLLDKYGHKRMCCRMRIMGTIPYDEIII